LSKTSRRASRVPGGPSAPPGPSPASGGPATGRGTATRAGRRERARTGYGRKSFFERYRSVIVALAIVSGIVLLGAVLVVGVTAKSYSCGRVWVPDPTPDPSPGQSPRLGYVQRDMGAGHNPGNPARYALCPPASGPHLDGSGGPIQPRLYGPDDVVLPQGWIHNLEHGGIVILYRGGEGSEAITEAGQEKLRQLYATFPNSPICGFPPSQRVAGVVVTRFDEMATPYAALVWDRVLPLETLDADAIYEFWRTEGERTNSEKYCTEPTPSPGPSGSVAPSGSATPSGSVAPSGGAAPSPAAS
jgi:hypothetical protein